MPRWPVTLLLAACISVAIGTSGYLLWADVTSSPIVGCGSGGGWVDCGQVASSRWSLWLGVPVSLLALGIYLAMALGLVGGAGGRFSPAVRRVGWAVVTAVAFAAGLSAVWFVGLQLVVLKHVCVYCMIAHACGLIVTVAMLLASPLRAKAKLAAAVAGLAGFAILVVGQMFTSPPVTHQIERFDAPSGSESEPFEFSPPATESPADRKSDDDLFQAPTTDNGHSSAPLSAILAARFPRPATRALPTLLPTALLVDDSRETAAAERRMASIQGGAIKLDIAQWPLSGSQDAEFIVVELFDYCCSPCRKTHTAMACAQERLGNQLAVVCLPTPLNAACNPTVQVTHPVFKESCDLAKLAVAVWRVDPSRFASFHNWLFEGAQAPSLAAAKAKAATLVDAKQLAAELASGVPDQYIAKHVEIYKRAGEGTIPKLMFPRTSVVGELSSVNELIELIRREAK